MNVRIQSKFLTIQAKYQSGPSISAINSFNSKMLVWNTKLILRLWTKISNILTLYARRWNGRIPGIFGYPYKKCTLVKKLVTCNQQYETYSLFLAKSASLCWGKWKRLTLNWVFFHILKNYFKLLFNNVYLYFWKTWLLKLRVPYHPQLLSFN